MKYIKFFFVNLVFPFIIVLPIFYLLKIIGAIKDEILMRDYEIIEAIIEQNRINKKAWDNIRNKI